MSEMKKTPQKKKIQRRIKLQPRPKVDWFALMGYDKTNEDHVGFLALDAEQTNKKKIYKIVDSIPEALRFPSVNISGSKTFGTPQQWLEFFNNDSELSDWSFHLIKTKAPKA